MDKISIHALLAESDAPQPPQSESSKKFLSTLSLRRATECTSLAPKPKTFLSTLSLRRATLVLVFTICLPRDFYPRSPCGERPSREGDYSMGRHISIHALLAESDLPTDGLFFFCRYFYPRSPCGERPRCHCLSRAVRIISIHALLAESDHIEHLLII